MIINNNVNSPGVDGPTPPRRPASASRRAPEHVSFAGSDAVESSLQNVPASRKDAVENAKLLIGDVKYPPLEIIRGISKLLAENLDSGNE